MSESSNTQRSDVDTHQATPVAVPRTNIVPLIKPRYQKKQRTNHRIEVTDSSEDRLSATQALLQHTKEVLTVHNGPMSYEQEMYFHPYELYKHGKHQIHTRSIGYTSGCDLVVTREAISEPSDVDLGFVRRHAEIDKAICLDPKARRPLTERESGKKLRLNAPRYRKYPGIRAPKNRKERNRLLNDYFATEYARKIMEKYRERQNKGECDGDVSPPVRPAFGNLPPVFYDILDLDEDAQTRALERCGVNLQPTVNNVPKNPDSGEARFQSMNARLRGEMLHALSSEFLSRQIDDLERAFVNYIAEGDANKPLVYNFRDGYGRLVCHGVAAYYHLVSESQYQADGTKITVVSWPKKKRKGCQTLTLPHTSLMQLLRKKRNDMPSCSPASTPQTTPFVRPGEADAVPPPFNLDGTPLGCESLVGLTPTPKPEESPGEPSLLGIAVYEPMPVNASYGANMTATQKKKMRKAMRASERAADDLEKTCAPHLDGT
ncbi:hypothetical protein DQ04_04921050 [Trypanosoma grayi]|uniref:hypothetical protein n=1 Tax=Trypanosoma grayi TaxID=71804 RepID=UPI0004F41211|nr:hypothetical protein DQ04_04921050 [Trypanosoma grayi]KEG09630.1 hypothetical protein DQ04_04921050 [Trypanosoma grayi]